MYIFLFPNLTLNRYGPILDCMKVTPISPHTCRVSFDYFVEQSAMTEDSIQAAMTAGDLIQKEDMIICARVQTGMRSGSFEGGRYAAIEKPQHHFHCILYDEMLKS
jgi:choline monooxygenase